MLLISPIINENVPGAAGKALRLDGYSTFAQGKVKNLGDLENATFSIWVAPETYPVIEMDTPTVKKTILAGTLDETLKKGWAFALGYTGKYSFKSYSGNWPVEVEATDLLPCYEWSHIVAVFNGTAKTITLYRNGKKVGEGRAMNVLNCGSENMTVGKIPGTSSGSFSLDTFNGLIDDIEVDDRALQES